MLHIITDENNTLAGVILSQLKNEDNVNIINFSKKKKSFFEKLIRYIESKFFLINNGLSLPKETRSEFKKISSNDSVLLFDIDYVRDLQIICKTLPKTKKRSIFLWNPIKTHDGKNWKVKRNLKIFNSLFDSVCTFDPSDSKKYSLNLVPQPFFKPQILDSEKNIDLYFIGSDKGRLQQLISIKKNAELEGLKCHFHIIPSKRVEYSKEEKNYLSSKEISYEENLVIASRSKCLVEIVQENQSGPTMRTMEAAFLGCKLLTNRKSASSDVFFHSNNIFILKNNVHTPLTPFLKSKMENFDHDIYAAHDIRNWWRQFL